jgi:anti-sigma factor RsiW
VRSNDSFGRWDSARTSEATMRVHPSEGQLQALLDGELPIAREIIVRAHLRRCDSCRARIDAARETTTMVGALISRSAPTVDRESAWQRFVVLSGGRAELRPSSGRRWASALAMTAATAVIVVALLRTGSSVSPGEEAFALVREAQAHPANGLLRDACCSDHDGGDLADDGLLTVSTPGEKVTVVIVYEDLDGSGTFTHGDIVRYVSTIPHAGSPATPAP